MFSASRSSSDAWGKRAQRGRDLVEVCLCGGVIGLVEDRAHERGNGLLRALGRGRQNGKSARSYELHNGSSNSVAPGRNKY
jgi:hypothetical protein